MSENSHELIEIGAVGIDHSPDCHIKKMLYLYKRKKNKSTIIFTMKVSFCKNAGMTILLAALLLSPHVYAQSRITASASILTAHENNNIVSVQETSPTSVDIKYNGNIGCTLDFYGENIFRLFQDNQGGKMRMPQATPPAQILVDNARKEIKGIKISEHENEWLICTREIEIRLHKISGLMSVTDLKTGKIVLEEIAHKKFEGNRTTLTFKAHPHEHFYGGGVQNGRFSHRGESIAIENTNVWVDGGVASPTPFYWSTNGYGIMWHTFKPGRYDFGSKEADKVFVSHSENYLDVFIMVNATPAALLNDFYQLSGNPILLPKFGFYEGHLNAYNRDYWTEAENGFMLYEDGKRYNESQKPNGGYRETLNGEKDYQFSARAAIDRYERNDMPLGWFLPNDGYGAGYGQTGTLEGNIENLKRFGDYARSKGVEIGLWTQSDLHPKEGVEALLQRDIIKEVKDAGVRILKTDVAWVGSGYSFGLNGVADVSRIMPQYGNDARPFIISLDGWAGTQRYAGIWSGDQVGGDWEYIRFHIPTFIGSGLSGQPNITSDVDGIFGGKNTAVNVREFQWKTFTPMELNMDGWGSNPKYPEALGEPATSINRWYLKLKSELLPYTYTIAREAVEGKPIIRAMFLEDCNPFTLGKSTQYQFMYGPYFLIAPIYQETNIDQEGNDIRNGIYLPEGKWIDYYNGDVYEGGRLINNYAAPLWKLPVFVKSGAIIPMTPPNNNPTQIKKDYRIYEIYADGHTSFTEYDDDGNTQAYLTGECTRTIIESHCKKNILTVSIQPTSGRFKGFEPQKQTEFRINISRAPKKVTAKIGNRKVKLTAVSSKEEFSKCENAYFYDAHPNLNCFATPGSEFANKTIWKNPQLLVKLGKTDITTQSMEVVVNGFIFDTKDKMKIHSGSLQTPQISFPADKIEAYTITPTWEKIENADFYEIEFDSMLYSTIRDQELVFEYLTPETEYNFKLRAVNKDGVSPWSQATVKTQTDPLEFAIKGIKATVSCTNQPGSGVNKLFDFDPKTHWHTKWASAGEQGGSAVPFDMTIDLRSINTLDRLVYQPREDGGNGTLLKGSITYSCDKQNWSNPETFEWARNSEMKTFHFNETPTARYIRIHIDKAVGNFGSGNELHIFKVSGTESILQGDINKDRHIDENDFTSYMNYTGLRKGDSDFDYVSSGDINHNGLIDAFDISVVATELDGGVRNSSDHVKGNLAFTPNKKEFVTGDTIEITVSGKGLHYVNALSFALPYSTDDFEYMAIELKGMKEMINLTYDRLHTNGQKALYPTFVNRGNNFLLEEGNHELFVIRFRAKRDGIFKLQAQDGILVDRNLGTVTF